MGAFLHERAYIQGVAVAKQFEEDRIDVCLWIILSTVVIYDQREFL